MAPHWLDVCSRIALGAAFISAAWLVVEQFRRPQRMWIMAIVWPVTALYMGPAAVWAYYAMGAPAHAGKKRPMRQSTFTAVTHCGAGCTLGDICADFAIYVTGFTIAGGAFVTALAGDFTLAYLFGIAFQYYTIAPMRNISGLPAIWAAMKADTLSLIAFELGLFGWMALVHYVFFKPDLTAAGPVYWFMMQIGMCLGFITAYPANWLLLRRGLKEPM